MALANRVLGLILLFLLSAVAISISPAIAQQEATTPPRLTEEQIKRFFNSYPPVHKMAQHYWGKRKHTPPHKMLDPEGTFERAMSEMRWAGKLPEFDNLLRSYGYADRKSWMTLANRISHAYVTLRLRQKNPERAEIWRKARMDRMAYIEKERKKAEALPPGLRKQELQMLRGMQNELERERRGEIDADSLKPFYAQFEEMDKYLIEKKPW